MYPLKEKSVVYVFDAYCGWCRGFSQRMSEFEQSNREAMLARLTPERRTIIQPQPQSRVPPGAAA